VAAAEIRDGVLFATGALLLALATAGLYGLGVNRISFFVLAGPGLLSGPRPGHTGGWATSSSLRSQRPPLMHPPGSPSCFPWSFGMGLHVRHETASPPFLFRSLTLYADSMRSGTDRGLAVAASS